jgi:hypothetical protein
MNFKRIFLIGLRGPKREDKRFHVIVSSDALTGSVALAVKAPENGVSGMKVNIAPSIVASTTQRENQVIVILPGMPIVLYDVVTSTKKTVVINVEQAGSSPIAYIRVTILLPKRAQWHECLGRKPAVMDVSLFEQLAAQRGMVPESEIVKRAKQRGMMTEAEVMQRYELKPDGQEASAGTDDASQDQPIGAGSGNRAAQ